jgi:hypothetical protein
VLTLNALQYCTGFGLSQPSVPEAVRLAKKFDVPGVSGFEEFWTDGQWFESGTFISVSEDGALASDLQSNPHQTVCVTDPSA